MNRNHTRVLNEQQIKDITEQVVYDLRQYPLESADTLIDHYLRGDVKGLFEIITNWIETAEDEVKRQLNTDLMEDSFNDDQYNPHYDY
jgi:hypothetical protein